METMTITKISQASKADNYSEEIKAAFKKSMDYSNKIDYRDPFKGQKGHQTKLYTAFMKTCEDELVDSMTASVILQDWYSNLT